MHVPAQIVGDGRAKDEFLAILSHELRTPLNAILGWARMLRLRPEDQDTADRALTAIERNAESQARLVEDLLDMARIVTGKLKLNIEPIEIAAVAEAALDAVRPAADAKGVQLTARLDAGRLPARGDAARLQQVVWNLLTNAVKFTPSGGHVELLASSSNDLITICVQDDGEGIGPELLPHIFNRYRQGQNPVSGLGLGLAIAREVIELHGGSLVAHSDGVGRGARFEMRLPAAALALA
jgi:signal transduction histidine kinase